MAPVKLYGPVMSAATARSIVALEEKGVEYELVEVKFATGEHKRPPHTDRNPFGQVPAFEDGDLTLFESRAISKYIAYKHKDIGTDLLGHNNPKKAALIEVWIEVEAQQYQPAISPIIFQTLVVPRMGGKPDEAIIATNVEKLGKVLDVYEAKLSKTKYLAGDSFSLADLNHFPFTFYLMTTSHSSMISSRPHVKAWWESICSRPAIKKVADSMDAAARAAHGGAK